MKKLFYFFAIIITISLFTTSCQSKSGHRLEEKKKKQDSLVNVSAAPADLYDTKKDSTVSFVPTHIGLTKLQIDKVEGECSNTGGTNIDVSFEIHIKDSVGINLTLPFHGWDCDDDQKDGKNLKELYATLLKTKTSDFVLTGQVTQSTFLPTSLKIKEKWNVPNDGGLATIEPEKVIWNQHSY